MNEFNPGDVVAHPEYGNGIVQRKGWVGFEGRDNSLNAVAADLRRLVVIDPEDHEQVERLAEAHQSAVSVIGWDKLHPNMRRDLTDAMKTALREFANPKAPKPEEPTGLGAVVEDSSGWKWIRVGLLGHEDADDWKYAGLGGGNYWKTYADIDAVRVLSEGVQP